MDRWSLVATLNYLSHDAETNIVLSKAPQLNTENGRKMVSQMVTVADLTRTAFMNGDLSTVMSPMGRKRPHLPRRRLRLPSVVPEQMR